MTNRPLAKSTRFTLPFAWLIGALLLIAMLGAAACGSGDAPNGGGTPLEPTPAPDSSSTGSTGSSDTVSENNQEAQADSTGEAIADPASPDSVKIGRSVGERIIDFDLALDDGTTRSTAEPMNRPTIAPPQ